MGGFSLPLQKNKTSRSQIRLKPNLVQETPICKTPPPSRVSPLNHNRRKRMQLSQPGVPIQALAAGEVHGHAHPSQGLLGYLSAKTCLNFHGFLHCRTRFPVISRSSPASPAGLAGKPGTTRNLPLSLSLLGIRGNAAQHTWRMPVWGKPGRAFASLPACSRTTHQPFLAGKSPDHH